MFQRSFDESFYFTEKRTRRSQAPKYYQGSESILDMDRDSLAWSTLVEKGNMHFHAWCARLLPFLVSKFKEARLFYTIYRNRALATLIQSTVSVI